ncbi:hypothetical protein [Aliiglaciecola sp. LCG003]|uniref:hypothetical protein n=1 Tax=Aliiglaciecola sp. LCG003 TaxID=3053655 RepID=UPI002572DB76|nr:hypothetical protein [Aliiglaciecola sp. LCG003]WJG07735.1 hypothetical protein QR722_10185 [Aliiglaciecola sp. LCG003]
MSTRQKLIQVIIEHYSGTDTKKLNITSAAKKIGKSRQYIYQDLDDLVPYIKGENPYTDLLDNESEDDETVALLLQNSYTTIENLKEQLRQQLVFHQKEIKDVEARVFTTMMNNDIALHEADEVRIAMEKQALHFSKLVKDNKKLKNDLVTLEAKMLSINIETYVESNVIHIEPELLAVFKNFLKTKDMDVFEEEKDLAIEKVILKVQALPENKKVRIVIFIERYLSQVSTFLSRVKQNFGGDVIVISLPVYSTIELRLYLNKIKSKGHISIWVPVTESDIVAKAQRKFHFSHVPQEEFEMADKMQLPKLTDGFDEVTHFKVQQGE